MTTVLTILVLVFGQSTSEVKVSISIDPTKPVADGTTLFVVQATVTDKKGKPLVGKTVRFRAHGYMEAPDGTIVGRYQDMIRGVGYRNLIGGGLMSGDPKAPITNTVDVKTDEKGIAIVSYQPRTWLNFMEKVPTRVTAWYEVDGSGQPSADLDITFTKPKN